MSFPKYGLIKKLRKQNVQLRDLVEQMYYWTEYKETPWAKRAKKILEETK